MNITIMSKNLRLGMRTVKTAIAILICLVTGHLLQYHWPLYAGIAAIVSMQDTPAKSLTTGKARLVGTGIGGLLGIVFLWIYMFIPFDEAKIVLATVAVIIGVMICVFIEQKEACSICGVVVLVIMLAHSNSDSDIYFYALTRIIETAAGVIVAFLVNRYIWYSNTDENDCEQANAAAAKLDK